MPDPVKNFLDNTLVDLIFKGFVVLLLPWGLWLTNNQFEDRAFRQRGDRFTDRDALEMEKSFLSIIHLTESRLDSRIDGLPPPEWRERLLRVETDLRMFEREFTAEFIRKDELPSLLP